MALVRLTLEVYTEAPCYKTHEPTRFPSRTSCRSRNHPGIHRLFDVCTWAPRRAWFWSRLGLRIGQGANLSASRKRSLRMPFIRCSDQRRWFGLRFSHSPLFFRKDRIVSRARSGDSGKFATLSKDPSGDRL